MADLKPCPFCGGKPITQSRSLTRESLRHWIRCPYCYVMTTAFKGADAAAESWNRRAQDVRGEAMEEAAKIAYDRFQRYRGQQGMSAFGCEAWNIYCELKSIADNLRAAAGEPPKEPNPT